MTDAQRTDNVFARVAIAPLKLSPRPPTATRGFDILTINNRLVACVPFEYSTPGRRDKAHADALAIIMCVNRFREVATALQACIAALETEVENAESRELRLISAYMKVAAAGRKVLSSVQTAANGVQR